ncbi:hypothetical protein ACS0TY_016000 [Phlomoides rotata]
MSLRANRHQRRPSQSVFVIPENLTAPLTAEEIAPPPPVAQPPVPPPEKSSDGVHLPPVPPPKPAEKMPTSDRSRSG